MRTLHGRPGLITRHGRPGLGTGAQRGHAVLPVPRRGVETYLRGLDLPHPGVAAGVRGTERIYAREASLQGAGRGDT